ncbi:MAG TPA: hypothetical protein VGA07_00335 [Anaerolineales bacterium]
MSERRGWLTFEALAWAAILLLAAWTRLAALGRLPLDDTEAVEALAAAASGGSPSAFWEPDSPTATPSYHALTGLLFATFGPADALARIIPALAGVGLVMTPVLARKSLGRGPALVAGLILLLSPSALTIARSASGASLAALGWAVALLCLIYRKGFPEQDLTWAAAGAGLALASGVHSLTGLLTLALGGLLLSLWDRRRLARAGQAAGRKRRKSPGWLSWTELQQASPASRRLSLLVGGLVLFGLSAGAGLLPSGLSGLLEGVAGWAQGWITPSGYRLLPFLAMLPLYEPLALVFGLVGVRLTARASDSQPRLETAWAAASLLLLLIYPGRSPLDLIWVVLPLALLGGRAIAALLEELPQIEAWSAVGGFGAAAVVLVAYAALQVAGYATGALSFDVQLDFALQLGLAALGLLLAVLALLFLGWGWSWRSALQAAGLAGLALTGAVTLSAAWRLNFTPVAATAGELWRREVSTPGLRLLGHSLQMVSQSQTGRIDALPVRVVSPATPGLAWELREFRAARDDPQGQASQVVLTPVGEQPPALAEDYLGQSFTIGERWDWDGGLPPNFLRWLVTRQAPTEAERWLLLVRSDLAGAGELGPLPEQPEPAS